jgi:hypothetical protein
MIMVAGIVMIAYSSAFALYAVVTITITPMKDINTRSFLRDCFLISS